MLNPRDVGIIIRTVCEPAGQLEYLAFADLLFLIA
jgi:hypothetical protein